MLLLLPLLPPLSLELLLLTLTLQPKLLLVLLLLLLLLPPPPLRRVCYVDCTLKRYGFWVVPFLSLQQYMRGKLFFFSPPLLLPQAREERSQPPQPEN